MNTSLAELQPAPTVTPAEQGVAPGLAVNGDPSAAPVAGQLEAVALLPQAPEVADPARRGLVARLGGVATKVQEVPARVYYNLTSRASGKSGRLAVGAALLLGGAMAVRTGHAAMTDLGIGGSGGGSGMLSDAVRDVLHNSGGAPANDHVDSLVGQRQGNSVYDLSSQSGSGEKPSTAGSLLDVDAAPKNNPASLHIGEVHKGQGEVRFFESTGMSHQEAVAAAKDPALQHVMLKNGDAYRMSDGGYGLSHPGKLDAHTASALQEFDKHWQHENGAGSTRVNPGAHGEITISNGKAQVELELPKGYDAKLEKGGTIHITTPAGKPDFDVSLPSGSVDASGHLTPAAKAALAQQLQAHGLSVDVTSHANAEAKPLGGTLTEHPKHSGEHGIEYHDGPNSQKLLIHHDTNGNIIIDASHMTKDGSGGFNHLPTQAAITDAEGHTILVQLDSHGKAVFAPDSLLGKIVGGGEADIRVGSTGPKGEFHSMATATAPQTKVHFDKVLGANPNYGDLSGSQTKIEVTVAGDSGKPGGPAAPGGQPGGGSPGNGGDDIPGRPGQPKAGDTGGTTHPGPRTGDEETPPVGAPKKHPKPALPVTTLSKQWEAEDNGTSPWVGKVEKIGVPATAAVGLGVLAAFVYKRHREETPPVVNPGAPQRPGTAPEAAEAEATPEEVAKSQAVIKTILRDAHAPDSVWRNLQGNPKGNDARATLERMASILPPDVTFNQLVNEETGGRVDQVGDAFKFEGTDAQAEAAVQALKAEYGSLPALAFVGNLKMASALRAMKRWADSGEPYDDVNNTLHPYVLDALEEIDPDLLVLKKVPEDGTLIAEPEQVAGKLEALGISGDAIKWDPTNGRYIIKDNVLVGELAPYAALYPNLPRRPA